MGEKHIETEALLAAGHLWRSGTSISGVMRPIEAPAFRTIARSSSEEERAFTERHPNDD